MGLLEYDQHEVIGPLLRLLAEAMRDKMPAEEESDESMPAEANSQRGRRYADLWNARSIGPRVLDFDALWTHR